MAIDRTQAGSIEADRDVAFHVSARAAAVFILIVAAGAVACRFLDAEQASTAALKVVGATLVVGIVPGALATLLWRPRPQISALEVAGFGIAISFGVAHLLTIAAVSAHASAAVMVVLLLAGITLMAGLVIRQSPGTIVVSLDELIVIALLLAMGWCLYLVGAPVNSPEDQIHASIVRRLSELVSPRLDNLYVVPNIVYTYPFPGTHYFMALVARLGDVDALFVYHKLRFFWGPTALLMLYLMARTVFGTRAIACASALTAGVFVFSGIFAMGFSWGWGQLVPYSHASDVAMTVLLPALLVVAFGYLQADSTREQAFFFAATASLALMLTMVHIREIVQCAVYLGCFAVVTAACRGFRPYLRRTLALLVLTLAVAAVYGVWQAQVIPLVDDIVAGKRAELISIASTSSLRALMFTPATTLIGEFVQLSGQVFRDLFPLVLFAGPAVVLLFRHRPLVWLISASTLAYLAVMSIPLLAIPYIYLTYFEILATPVRNIIFFTYVSAGAPLYVAVVALTRVDRTRLSPLVAGAIGGALALLTVLCINQSHWGFFAPLMAAYGLTFVFLDSGGRKATGTRKVESRVFQMAGPRNVVAAVVSLAALAALWPDHPPTPRSEQVVVRWTSGLAEARRQALERQFSLGAGEPKPDRTDDENTWNYRLTDLSIDNVRAIVRHPDAVDTHFIDRSTFTVLSQRPSDDHPLGVQYVRWLQYPGMPLLVGTAVLVWVIGLVVPGLLASARGDRAIGSLETALNEPFYRRAVPYVLFIIPFALWSARPTLSPLVTALTQPAGGAATPKAMMGQLPCLTTPPMQARFSEHLFENKMVMLPEQTSCPPAAAVIEWIRTHVPVQAVFANDRWNLYPPSLFTAQQIVVYPTLEPVFVSEDQFFQAYYRFFYDRMRRYQVQPFFNSVETPAERAAFVKGLGITHVLVGPPHYGELRPVLDRLRGPFALRYDQAGWAVYEVIAGN